MTGRVNLRARGVVIAMLAAAPYVAHLTSPFVFDDHRLIVDNPALYGGPADWYAEAPFRVVTTTSYAVVFHLFPLDPLIPLHITSTLIHIVCAWLVYAVLARLGTPRSAATCGACVFALHPLATETVIYMSARATQLAVLCALTGMWMLLLSARTTRRVAPVLFLAALFAKEEALASLPLAALLLNHREMIKPAARRRWTPVLAWTAALAVGGLAYAFARSQHILMLSEDTGAVSLRATVLTSGMTLAEYLRLILWPAPASVEHPLAMAASPASWRVLIPAALAVCALLYILARRRVLATPCVWGIWIPIALTPTLFMPLADPVVEHRAYWALVAVAGLAAAAARYAHTRNTPAVRAVITGALITGTALGVARAEMWRDPVSLWRAAHRAAPDRTRPLDNLGLAYLAAGDLARAEWCWRSVLTMDPDDAAATLHLGVVAKERGEYDAALELYKRAYTLAPTHSAALSNAAGIYHFRGDIDRARLFYLKALQANDRDADAHYGLGFIARQEGDFETARREFEAALAIDPRDFHTRLFLAEIVGMNFGETEVARNHCAAAARFAPTADARQRAEACRKKFGGP